MSTYRFRPESFKLYSQRDTKEEILGFTFSVQVGDGISVRETYGPLVGTSGRLSSGDTVKFFPNPDFPAYTKDSDMSGPGLPWELEVPLDESSDTDVVTVLFTATSARKVDSSKLPGLLLKIGAAAIGAAVGVASDGIKAAVEAAIVTLFGEGGADLLDDAFDDPGCPGPVYALGITPTVKRVKTLLDQTTDIVRGDDLLSTLTYHAIGGRQTLDLNDQRGCGNPDAQLFYDIVRVDPPAFAVGVPLAMFNVGPVTGAPLKKWTETEGLGWGDAGGDRHNKVLCLISLTADSKALDVSLDDRLSDPLPKLTESVSRVVPGVKSTTSYAGDIVPTDRTVPRDTGSKDAADAIVMPKNVLLQLYEEFFDNGQPREQYRVRYIRMNSDNTKVETDVMLKATVQEPR